MKGVQNNLPEPEDERFIKLGKILGCAVVLAWALVVLLLLVGVLGLSWHVAQRWWSQ